MKRWPLAATCLVLGLVIGGLCGHPFLQGQAPKGTSTVPGERTSYRDIVKKVLPAVVSIESKGKPLADRTKTPRRRPLPDDPGIPEEFRRFFEQESPDSSPAPRTGFGSGFFVDAKGIILTNNHVVEGGDQVLVTLQDGRRFTSKDIKTDPKTDLAIIRLETQESLPSLELGDSNLMEIGDRVLAVGAPFGLTGTVTSGIISSKGRSLRMNMYEDFLQTDAAINPGNSGGPLVNLEGKVIGINSAIKSRTGGFQGVGMAIASNLARNVMQQLVRDGVVRRGYLGVGIKDLVDRDLATRLGVEGEGGVLVTQVYDKAPGAKAGLKEGDVIVGLAGRPIREGRDLQMTVAGLPLGKPTDVRIVRDGQSQTLRVTLEEQPADFGTERTPPIRTLPRRPVETVNIEKIGVEVSDTNPELLERLGFPKEATGALIARIRPDSLADEAGLDRGILVTKVEQKPITSAESLKEAIDKGSLEKGLLLQVQTPQGGSSFVLLKTGRK